MCLAGARLRTPACIDLILILCCHHPSDFAVVATPALPFDFATMASKPYYLNIHRQRRYSGMYITHLLPVMERNVHRNTISCVLEYDYTALLLAMSKGNNWIA